MMVVVVGDGRLLGEDVAGVVVAAAGGGGRLPVVEVVVV